MELEQDSSDSLHCLSGLPFLNAENRGLVHSFFLIEKGPEVEHLVYLVDILGVVDDHLVPGVGGKDLFPELNLGPEGRRIGEMASDDILGFVLLLPARCTHRGKQDQ